MQGKKKTRQSGFSFLSSFFYTVISGNVQKIQERQKEERMKVQKLGHFVDGREVHLFTMENKNGVKASFTDLGGVWLSLLFPNPNRLKRFLEFRIPCK